MFRSLRMIHLSAAVFPKHNPGPLGGVTSSKNQLSTLSMIRISARNPVCHQTRLTKTRQFSNQIVDGTEGTYKPSPFQQKILVWTKTYPSEDKIPARITRAQMKKAMDKFRVKASMYMVAMTAITAAIFAYFGRKARHEGYSVGKEVLARRERLRQEHQESERSNASS